MSIKLDLKIFLFLLLFLLTSQIDMYILLMLFACIHELAHLFTGMLLGFKPGEIKITPIGLQISFRIKCEEYNHKIRKGNTLGIKKAIIAAAGPIMNFLISIFFIILYYVGKIDINNIFYQNIIYANVLIGLFNLVPIYPLDGGRILNEIFHIFVGLKKSNKYTHNVSKVLVIILTMIASVAIIYLQNISVIVILGYLWVIVINENRIYQRRKELERIEQQISEKENKQEKEERKIKEAYSGLYRSYRKTCKIKKTMVK